MDRLDSWKEIAAYLGRGVTTVQRWEQEERLPIHRLAHAKKGSVFAFKSELDAWRATRTSSAPSVTVAEPESTVRGTVSWRRGRGPAGAYVSAAALVSCALAALGILWARGLAGSPPSADPLPATAGVPRPLANDSASEAWPSISPDGERVVYSWLRAEDPGLYIKPVKGGPATALALGDRSKFASAGFAKWAPQGDRVAFLAHEAGDDQNTRGLYYVSASGGTPRRLMSISGTGLCWSADGQSLGFADRASTGEPFSIFVVSVTTNQRRRLTTPPAGTFGDTRCAFSPNGRRLAVSRYSSRYQSDLYAIPLDVPNGAAERLTYDFSGIQGIEWAPNGEAVVFGSHNGLWTIEASAQPRRRPALVTGIGNALMQPAFARPTAGGTARLVYEHNVRDVNMWRWDAKPDDGRGTITRIAGSTMWEDHPALSPDGRLVAFASNRTGNNEIWTANIDGSDPKQLTFFNGPIVISPQWSPDGRRIAFSSQADGNRDIYLIRADGSQPTRLTWETSQEENPSWSRDGRWVYFRSDRGGIAQMWKIGSEGGSPVRVTTGMASQGFESPEGQLLYFVRSMDVPGLWSVPVGGGAETFVLGDVREAFWGVANRGIVFLVSEPNLSPNGPTIRYFDFLSRKASTLATLPTGSNPVSPGFAVSEDARAAVWIQVERSQSDVMLMDSWRQQ